MENKFEKAYSENRSIREAYDRAKAEGDQAGLAKAREDMAGWREHWKNEPKPFGEIYREYEESRDNGNELLNINDHIKNVEEWIGLLKENGIRKFTFSSGWSSAIQNAWELNEHGCRQVGMAQVKTGMTKWTEECEYLGALVFEIE